MDIVSGFLGGLVSQPVVQGMIAKTVIDVVQAFLKKVDEQHLVQPYEPWLSPAALVLSFIVSAIHAAQTGTLHTIDLNSAWAFIQVMAVSYLGVKATGTDIAVNLVNKVKAAK